jgi:flagellar hook-associated protein 2
MATTPINFSGIASSTDWVSIVAKLVELEKVPMNRMATWKTGWEDKIKSIQGLNSRLLSLQSFVNSTNTMAKFQVTKAASSNTTVLNATSSSTAIPGSHTVTIGSTIPNKLASQGVAANSTVVSSRNGTMTIYVG